MSRPLCPVLLLSAALAMPRPAFAQTDAPVREAPPSPPTGRSGPGDDPGPNPEQASGDAAGTAGGEEGSGGTAVMPADDGDAGRSEPPPAEDSYIKVSVEPGQETSEETSLQPKAAAKKIQPEVTIRHSPKADSKKAAKRPARKKAPEKVVASIAAGQVKKEPPTAAPLPRFTGLPLTPPTPANP